MKVSNTPALPVYHVQDALGAYVGQIETTSGELVFYPYPLANRRFSAEELSEIVVDMEALAGQNAGK